MIRLGIVGSNFGRNVLLPAFRRDKRCDVTAIAGTDEARAAKAASEAGIARSYGDWRALIDDKNVDAVAIAAPPSIQAAAALHALKLSKPVFAEKPLAADVGGARAIRDMAKSNNIAVAVDFEFTALATWRKAHELLTSGAIGALRHLAVSWQVENYATRMRLANWKTSADKGGGTLGNLASHSFHYLEWFCGPIKGLSARLSGLPGETTASETTAALAFDFASGASGSLNVSSGSFLGSGHRLEFHGEDGTLTLTNSTSDYMRGFEVHHAKRSAEQLALVPADDALGGLPDPRIAPVSVLAKQFLDAIESGKPAMPGVQDGYRVQWLIERARRAHREGRFLPADPATMTIDDKA